MIRILVVADSGSAMAAVTGTLSTIAGVDIAGYASGRAHVGPIALALQPDVTIVDQMGWSGLALKRIREVVAASPRTIVLGLSHGDSDWILDGLQAGATAVVPGSLPPGTLARVLDEVTAGRAAHTFELTAA